ncbi:phosphotransferase [Micromonospora sp. NPDC000089]|uniref:phosphotransferase n=1 Tax=unclassified Micromonospora TaxID=2617518 RepID=UPI0036781837
MLRHLEGRGFAGAPRALGLDDQGRELLSYLDGETVGEVLPWPDWVYADETLQQVGRWLRGLHDTTADFHPPADAVWFVPRPWFEGAVVGHNDAAPWNAVWRDGKLVGFVDWDTAAPTSRDFDLAYVALTWVPLQTPRLAEETGFTNFADRQRRLHLLLDAYGYDRDRHALRAAIVERARRNAQVIHTLAATGDPVYTNARMSQWAADLEQAAKEVEDLPETFWIAS